MRIQRPSSPCRFSWGRKSPPYHGNWYVLARNVAKNQVETFALSRFRRIETGGSPFTRPPDFSPETFARQAFGITGGEEPLKVRLLFEPKLD